LLLFFTAIKSHYIEFFVTSWTCSELLPSKKKAVREPTAEFREETNSFCRPGIATLCHDRDVLVKSPVCKKYHQMRLVDKHAEGLGTASSELRHRPTKGPLPPSITATGLSRKHPQHTPRPLDPIQSISSNQTQ
jgi:hypothetical protein